MPAPLPSSSALQLSIEACFVLSQAPRPSTQAPALETSKPVTGVPYPRGSRNPPDKILPPMRQRVGQLFHHVNFDLANKTLSGYIEHEHIVFVDKA